MLLYLLPLTADEVKQRFSNKNNNKIIILTFKATRGEMHTQKHSRVENYAAAEKYSALSRTHSHVHRS